MHNTLIYFALSPSISALMDDIRTLVFEAVLSDIFDCVPAGTSRVASFRMGLGGPHDWFVIAFYCINLPEATSSSDFSFSAGVLRMRLSRLK